jgi:hypothetical protein
LSGRVTLSETKVESSKRQREHIDRGSVHTRLKGKEE